MEKQCTHCLLFKHLEDFAERYEAPSGRASWCKQCMRERQRAVYGWHPRQHLIPEERFWQKLRKADTPNGCWIWIGGIGGKKPGYGTFWDGQRKISAHMFSYILHYGSIPKGLCVCHNCPGKDNPHCVNPGHLWLGTLGENVHDAIQKGSFDKLKELPHLLHLERVRQYGSEHWTNRHPEKRFVQERNPMAKLTAAKAAQIRKLAKQGWTQQALAIQFQCSQSTISDILTYKRWT